MNTGFGSRAQLLSVGRSPSSNAEWRAVTTTMTPSIAGDSAAIRANSA